MTFNHEIPWAPNTPGTPEQLNAISLWKRPSLAELTAIDVTLLPTYSNDAHFVVNVAGFGPYRYDPDSTATANTPFVMVPDSGSGDGRWILERPRTQRAIARVGKMDDFSNASYTQLDGAGDPRWLQSATGITDTITTGETSLTDVVGASITSPIATSGNNLLCGFTANIDSNGGGQDTAFTAFHDGSADTEFTGYSQVGIFSQFYKRAASTGSQTIKMQGRSGGSYALDYASGVLWAAEIASTAAFGMDTKSGSGSISATSYTDVNALSVTISPTNNPVLLLFCGGVNQNAGGGAVQNYFRFYDGSTGYGDYIWQNGTGIGAAYALNFARLTGSLNGSKTFTVQAYSGTGTNFLNLFLRRLVAVEIQGDYQVFNPAGAATISSASQATLNDGSNNFSLTLTVTEATKYVVFLTGYVQRTVGTGNIRLSLHIGSTQLIELNSEWENSTNGYKTPFVMAIPTSRLAPGTYTVTAKARTTDGTSSTYTLNSAQFFAVEFPQLTDGGQGEPSQVALDHVRAGGTSVTWDGQYKCSTSAELGLAIYESVNGGAETLVAEKVLATPGTNDASFTVDWLRPTDLAEGDAVQYIGKAKNASGTVDFAASRLMAVEA